MASMYVMSRKSERPYMLANVARMIDAAGRPFAPLERVTRSTVHTDPTAAESIGANIHFRAGVIADYGRQGSWGEVIRQPRRLTDPMKRFATCRRLTAAIPLQKV